MGPTCKIRIFLLTRPSTQSGKRSGKCCSSSCRELGMMCLPDHVLDLVSCRVSVVLHFSSSSWWVPELGHIRPCTRSGIMSGKRFSSLLAFSSWMDTSLVLPDHVPDHVACRVSVVSSLPAFFCTLLLWLSLLGSMHLRDTSNMLRNHPPNVPNMTHKKGNFQSKN